MCPAGQGQHGGLGTSEEQEWGVEGASWRLDPVLILKRGWVCSSVVVYLCVCISPYPPQGACGPMASRTLYTAVCVSVDSGVWTDHYTLVWVWHCRSVWGSAVVGGRALSVWAWEMVSVYLSVG